MIQQKCFYQELVFQEQQLDPNERFCTYSESNDAREYGLQLIRAGTNGTIT